MGCIIFLPGILGSAIKLGTEEVWPPTAWEAIFGYRRIEKLSDPAAVHGDPIAKVAIVDVYAPLLRDLTDIASGSAGAPRRSFHPFGYDWRVDIRDAAADVARRIDALPAADRADITIVGHSMGCLVARLILESGAYDQRPWHSSIKTFVALAGPHTGAATALIRALGMEGSTGLSASDIKSLAANALFPSLYQLLPAPGVAAVVERTNNKLTELDLYASTTRTRLGLAAGNLRKAGETHRILAKRRRPEHVEYVYLAGSGGDTWSRVDLVGTQVIGRKSKETGDGVVLLWSAVDEGFVHHAAPGTHDAVFKSRQIQTLLYNALGARAAAEAFTSGAAKPLLSLFATHPIYGLNLPVDLLLIPVAPTERLDGQLVVEFSDGDSEDFALVMQRPVRYEGAEIEQLRLRLSPPPQAGYYRVRFEGSHDVADGGAATFGVSEAGGPGGER